MTTEGSDERERTDVVEDAGAARPGDVSSGPDAASSAAGSAPPARDRPARLCRSRTDRVVAGVSGGVGRYIGVDPILVRVAWVVAFFVAFPAAVVGYVVAWAVIPEARLDGEDEGPPPALNLDARSARLVVGILLVGTGGFLLVRELFPRVDLELLGPLALIAVGVVVLVEALRR